VAPAEVLEVQGGPLLEACVAVIRAAFATVAEARGLTEASAPTHPSFMTLERLRGMSARGVRLFALSEAGQVIGCAALETSRRPGVRYLERLAVVPAARHRGHGRALVEHVVAVARADGAEALSIGIIDDDLVLKRWYEGLGFAVTGTRRFEHLPFVVCYMERRLRA
jgi:N-acetylglutamate synthase-like GNAT family acetyltransferase